MYITTSKLAGKPQSSFILLLIAGIQEAVLLKVLLLNQSRRHKTAEQVSAPGAVVGAGHAGATKGLWADEGSSSLAVCFQQKSVSHCHIFTQSYNKGRESGRMKYETSLTQVKVPSRVAESVLSFPQGSTVIGEDCASEG